MKKIKIDPISFFVWLWLFVVNGFFCGMNYVIAICIHEFGHYFTAKKFGYELSRFAISPYGVELSYFSQNIERKDELIIAFAGPAANLVSSIFVLALWWIVPEIYFFTHTFVFISFMLAFFNLLPAYPLDGGRVFVSLFSKFMSAKSAKLLTIVFNIILSIFFFVIFFVMIFFSFNPTYLLFSIFLLCGVLDLWNATKYEKLNIFTKKVKNFSRANFCLIDENVTIKHLLRKMEISKNTIFCLVLESGKVVNLSEKYILNLSLNFDIEKTLKEILKN